ncbi:MAG: glycosyltransferase [Muribaculaceae bacterium]|nr:glycosyltransferase [Muribaculaceae bacterium]
MKTLRLAIVAPCYNEEDMLPLSAPRLVALMKQLMSDGKIAQDSFLLFVNDGSRDRTWEIIEQLHASEPICRGLDLSRNVGHQNAIMAGMEAAIEGPEGADGVITIDVDLQDPLECIPVMIDDYYEGYDVVYGVRSSRESDSFLKRFTAESFYKLQAALGLKTIYNHADFRFMTRRVIGELSKYEERNLYLRGIIPMIGFPSTTVEEVRAEREAGTTKYTLRKMLRLAFDGISSFSITPIYMILGLGWIFILIALGMAVYVIVSLVKGSVAQGWASLMLSIWLVGGIVMISIGLVGLYVGKVYMETKHRPRYHIKKRLG